MQINCEKSQLQLMCVIVNFGSGSKVLKIAKKSGVLGGTIFLGKGTVRSKILEFLELCDIRKEIVLMVAEKSIGDKAIKNIDQEFQFKKPNHGIAFTSSIKAFLGSGNYCYKDNEESRGADSIMYKSIFVVVDKGRGALVMDAANKVGARGGTIINARGSGTHETSKVFSMDIEPEKEIVLILSEENITKNIVESIKKDLEIDKPGNGIMFIQDLNEVHGIY